jgi:hypothetical protein
VKTTRVFGWACLAVVALVGCGSPDPTEAENDGLDTGDLDFSTEEIRSTGSPPWVYGGSLPTLVSPKVVLSQSGHTVRVTGDLPEGWSGVVPYYASVEMAGARRVLTVVYPIATGASAALDSAARTFNTVSGIPYRPNGMAYPTTGPAYVTWGGFPFVAYNGGIAFHGPITYTTSTAGAERVYDWYLQRGPVSHGCNRMQGEHVVEFAHLIGFDMHNTWGANVRVGRRATVQVLRDYDRLSTGEAVDVDYPRWAGARAPTGPTRVFPTWNADEMPRLVCADNRATRRSNTPVPAVAISSAMESTPTTALACLAEESASDPTTRESGDVAIRKKATTPEAAAPLGLTARALEQWARRRRRAAPFATPASVL